MLMSVAEITASTEVYSELEGARVLITGLSPTCGVDVARAFAEHHCRLILQIPEPCPETDALLQIVSENAFDVCAHHDPIEDAENATRFTQKAAQIYGGIDTVINFIQISRYDLNSTATLEQIEGLLSSRLQAAIRATRVAANRMALTWTNGSILNVMRLPTPKSMSETALAGIARAGLAAMTKSEARRWAEQGVRINAIAPQTSLGARDAFAMDDCLCSEPEVAKMALYLASQRGAELTGHVLDSTSNASSNT